MQPSFDAAIRRVALILRLVGALWMVALASVLGVTGSIDRPPVVLGCVVLGVAWALVAWQTGLIERSTGAAGRVVAAVDTAVTIVITVLPAYLGETESFTGGYPFGSLLVALACVGRRGAMAAGAVLAALWLPRSVPLGALSVPFAISNMLLYALGTVVVVIGTDVVERNARRARIAESALAVAEERATTASHLHDSVLQTLALVQRRADEPNQVRALARRQERELREWLFGPAEDGGGPAERLTVATGLAAAAEDIQEVYGVTVAVVTAGEIGSLQVGEDRTAPVRALLGAAREAMANAADHSGVDRVDVFAEIADGDVAVYVRDRGVGFDVADVPGDRHGVRTSIVDRMRRVGGEAAITSSPGRGTEVRLRLPHDVLGGVG